MPVAGAIGSIAGGAMGSRAQANASAAEQQGQREAIQAQLAMFNQARADQIPLIQARNSALPLFMQLLGLNPIQFGNTSPGGVQMNIVGAKKNHRNWEDHFKDQLGIPGVGSIKSPLDTLKTPFRNFGDWNGSRMADDLGDASFTYGDGGTTYDQNGNVVTPSQQVIDAAGMSNQMIPGGSAQTQQPIDLNALIAATPGYQFRLGEGLKAVERSAAARGALSSGATMKGLQRYGEGLASQEYGDFANRLASLIGLGQTAATTAGGWGQNVGSNIGQNLANIGASRGSSYANQGNIWGNAIGGAANSFANYWANRSPSGNGGYKGPYT